MNGLNEDKIEYIKRYIGDKMVRFYKGEESELRYAKLSEIRKYLIDAQKDIDTMEFMGKLDRELIKNLIGNLEGALYLAQTLKEVIKG